VAHEGFAQYEAGHFGVQYLNQFHLIGDNGKETYWGIAWIELKKEKNTYIMQLRPELASAIKALHLFAQNTDYAINMHLQKYDFIHQKCEKPVLLMSTVKTFPRDPVVAKKALCHAGFKCEFDPLHETFPRIIDGLPYMETHHLIPLKYAGEFSMSKEMLPKLLWDCKYTMPMWYIEDSFWILNLISCPKLFKVIFKNLLNYSTTLFHNIYYLKNFCFFLLLSTVLAHTVS